MKKIPTLFVRDPDDRKHVLDEVTPGCEWVIEGQGTATRKWDGTCLMVRDGRLFKRREVKPGKEAPEGFEQIDADATTGKVVGWVPVGDGPEDRLARETFEGDANARFWNVTCELVGPKVNGNPEGFQNHWLRFHGDTPLTTEMRDVPLTHAGLGAYLLRSAPMEGIVWHHPDGRMAKLKRRDFA